MQGGRGGQLRSSGMKLRGMGGAEDKPDTPLDYWKIARKTAPLLWPENLHLKARVFAVGAVLVSARVANLMVPQLYKGAIDTLSGVSEEPSFPTNYIVAYSALRIFTALQRDVRAFIWLDVEQDTSRRIKLRVFSHLHSLSHKYHLNRKTGEVLKVMERGASSLQSLLNMCLFTIGPTLIDLILVCLILWIDGTGFIYSAIILITMSSYIVVTVYMNEWRKKFRRDMIEADNAANDRSVNSLINFETVKTIPHDNGLGQFFGMERREEKLLQDNIITYNKAAWKNESSLYALNAAQQGVMAAGGFACMVLSGKEVVSGTMTVGEFVMIQTYLMQLAQPLAWLGTAWRIVQQGFIDMEKMFQLLEVEPDIQDRPDATQLEVAQGHVSFDKVRFSYDNFKTTVLNDLTFEVKAGETIAFVGATGAGKSTIARLLLRFYDLSQETSGSGAILIDGRDIRDATQESLRMSIGVVPQDAILFNETIRYNLMYGRPDATEEEVENAAKAASVYDTIMGFPDKFDTKVGERGLRLSGGEKQRVAIARTILKNPKIVVLDEATSALDTHTEHRIQDALEKVCQGRTTLIIAHRLSTIIHAHSIAVLKDGSIAEVGSHSELLAQSGGLYAAMWQAQQQERESGDGSQGTEGEGPGEDNTESKGEGGGGGGDGGGDSGAARGSKGYQV